MSSRVGLETGGGVKVCPEGFCTGGGIEMPIFRYFVCCYLLPKIKLKRSIDLMSRVLGFFKYPK